jgi:hypothetical protein
MSERYPTYDDEMLAIFRNTPDDLTANWQGVLSEGQRDRLLRNGYHSLIAYPALGLAAVAVVFAVGEKPLAFVQWFLMALIVVGSCIGGLVGLKRRQQAIVTGRVERVSGPIHVYRAGRQGSWRVRIQEVDLGLPVAMHHVKQGGAYHVFYAPEARQIIAMQPDNVGY